jgi:hypothetical protein
VGRYPDESIAGPPTLDGFAPLEVRMRGRGDIARDRRTSRLGRFFGSHMCEGVWSTRD